MSWTDNDSTLEWSYDSLGRAVSEKSGANPIGTTGKTFAFGYDSTGNTVSIGYPDGTALNYARDAMGRMTSASLQGGATLGTYKYAGSRVLSIALQNSVTKTLTYDAAWRATFVEYKTATTSIKKFEYAWNVADKRVLEKRHHASGTGDNYDLDSLYRSIQVKAGVADPVAELANPGSQTVASTTALTMDTANNRTQRVVTTGAGQTTTNYAADALEFYTSVGGTARTRDANGNLRDDGTNQYAYDYRNRLVTVTRKSDSVVIAGYEYDSLSRRVGVTTSTGTARHCWIGAQLAMEYGSNGGVVSRRHYGANAGEVLSAQLLDVADLDGDGSTVDFVSITPLYDGAFDCVGSLDQTGALAESYVHSFDGTVTITGSTGQVISVSAIGWQQGYGRGYRDNQTGFVYNLHRYYNPSSGRFLTQDPAGSWYDSSALGNGYAWVGSGYRNGWDPLGLDVWIEGDSGREPAGHQSINVGDPAGVYKSYSFGVVKEHGWFMDMGLDFGLRGEVYEDLEKGGQIVSPEYYLYTSKTDDAEILKWLKGIEGTVLKYGILIGNCRTFSKLAFEKLKNKYEAPSDRVFRRGERAYYGAVYARLARQFSDLGNQFREGGLNAGTDRFDAASQAFTAISRQFDSRR